MQSTSETLEMAFHVNKTNVAIVGSPVFQMIMNGFVRETLEGIDNNPPYSLFSEVRPNYFELYNGSKISILAEANEKDYDLVLSVENLL